MNTEIKERLVTYPDQNQAKSYKDPLINPMIIDKSNLMINPMIIDHKSNLLNSLKIKHNPIFTKIQLNPFSMMINFMDIINADNVAEFAYPLAQFVQQVRPDYIIACDRGARIIGLAVHMLYHRLYGALPTRDHCLHFRRISRKVPAEAVQMALKPDVDRMLAATDSPTVLILDDWISTGGTKNLVHELFNKLSGGKVRVLYGVMRGDRADATGSRDSAAFGDWHDRTDLIGVDYDPITLRPVRVHPQTALAYRNRMSVGIDNFVRALAPTTV